MYQEPSLRRRSLLEEYRERERKRKERLLSLGELLNQPSPTPSQPVDLLETFGKVPSAGQVLEHVETGLEERAKPGPLGTVLGPVLETARKGSSGITKAIGVGVTAVGRGVYATAKPVVSPALRALNWWSDQVVEPLAATTFTQFVKAPGDAMEMIKGLRDGRSRKIVSLGSELAAEYERRRIAGNTVDTPVDALAAWHAATRNYQEKQSMWVRVPGELVVDPLNFVPVGKIPVVGRLLSKIDPIAAVGRVTARGKYLSPQGKVAFADGVTRDILNIAVRFNSPTSGPVALHNADEALERIKAFSSDPTAKYSVSDFMSNAVTEHPNLPLNAQLKVVRAVLDAGWKNKKTGQYEWDLLTRTVLDTDTPDTRLLISQILNTSLNAYEKTVGVRRPILVVHFEGKVKSQFPTPTAPTTDVGKSVQFKIGPDGELPKGWQGSVRRAMAQSGAHDVADVKELADVRKAAAAANLDVNIYTLYLNDTPNALLRFGYAFKKQVSPLFLFLNPGYWVANPGSNYTMAFLRHGLEMAKYPEYKRMAQRAGIDPGSFAQDNYGISKDAMSALSRGVIDDRAWIEKLPLLGRSAYGLRQWQQKAEQHAHVVHMVVGQRKIMRKGWERDVREMLQSNAITQEEAARLSNVVGPDDIARLLAPDPTFDAADAFAINSIRSPLSQNWFKTRFETIRDGQLPETLGAEGIPGRIVTDADIQQALHDYRRHWGPAGDERQRVLAEASVLRGDSTTASSPLNQPLLTDGELPQDAARLAKYQEIAAQVDVGDENFVQHVETMRKRRDAAYQRVMELGQKKNVAETYTIMQRMTAEGTVAASLSFQKSQDYHKLIAGTDPLHEVGRKQAVELMRKLRTLRTGINDEYTTRMEKIADEFVKKWIGSPDVSPNYVFPRVSEEMTTSARDVIKKLGMEEVDPTQVEDVGKQLQKFMDDTLEDVEKAAAAYNPTALALAPPIIPVEKHALIRQRFNDTYTFAQRRATLEAEHDLFNYGNKTSADLAMNIFSPYPFWSTRFILNLGTRFLSKPQQFEAFARVVQEWYKDTKELPPSMWFSEKLITLPSGAEVRLRPWSVMFPLGFPAIELLKRGADSDQNIALEDVVEAFQRGLGLNMYPYMEVAAGLLMPQLVDASGYGAIRPPFEVARNSVPLARYFKTVFGGLPDEKTNVEMVQLLQHAGMLSEADFNRSINLMREDLAKGKLGPVDLAQTAIDESTARYRRGEVSDLLARYLAKQFSDREMWRLIPGINASVLSDYDKKRWQLLKDAYSATDSNTAPTVVDRLLLSDSAPGLFVGGRWKMPEKLPLQGPIRRTWEETNEYHYQLSQISSRLHQQIRLLEDNMPPGPEFVKVLQSFYEQARYARQQARADHPSAAITRPQQVELRHALGQTPYPVNPLDEAYDSYIAIIEDPRHINPTTLEVDYDARQLALEKWKTDSEGVRGFSVDPDKGQRREMSAAEYIELRQSYDTTPVARAYHDFVELARGYWEEAENLPKGWDDVVKRAKVQPDLYRNDPRIAMSRKIIAQRRTIYRLRYLSQHGPALEEGLQIWLGYRPIWEQ